MHFEQKFLNFSSVNKVKLFCSCHLFSFSNISKIFTPDVRGRAGRQLGGSKGSRLWPGARVPYEFADTIDFSEWSIMQRIFSNISSNTNIQFVPR